MNRKETLDAAASCVLRDREQQHGAPENTFGLIAELWSNYLGDEICAADVAAMMILLKVARFRSNSGNADNMVDAAGYAACANELAVTQ